MLVTNEVLDKIRVAIEEIDYGQVVVNVNTSGKFIEISTIKKERLEKEGDTSAINGKIKAYRTDMV